MNILMIGNGFDLAHGLQTKYQDFLKWIVHEYNFFVYLKKQMDAITDNMEIKLDIPDEVNEEIIMSRMEDNIQKELWNMIDDNVWFQLFFRHQKYMRENWIDFESVISLVIQKIDEDMIKYQVDETDSVSVISVSYFNKYFKREIDAVLSEDTFTYGKLIKRLESDLDRLIRSLEIYLCEYVETQNVSQLEIIKKLNPDYVLSFNYTDTYEKHYGNGKKIEYDYIHGKANIKNSVDTSNMVLGIDEYLLDDRVNKDVEFIAFKKFYQRIHKETGCKYRDWVDEIRDRYQLYKEDKKKQEQFENMNIPDLTQMKSGMKYRISSPVEYERHKLYIFGHSLDVTDKDVLRDLILNDNVFTTIYYYNRKVYGQQIANLVKVIGRDELIRRTGGNTKTIEFVDQQKSEKEDI